MAVIDQGKYVLSYTQTPWVQFEGIVGPTDFKLYTNGTRGYLAYANSTNATYAGRADGTTTSFTMKTVPDVDSFAGTVGILNYNQTAPSVVDFNVVKGTSIYRYDASVTVDNSSALRGNAVYAGPVDSVSAINPCGLWDRYIVQFDQTTGDTLARTEFTELATLRYRTVIPTDNGVYVFGLEQVAGSVDPGPLRIYKITMPDVVGPVDGTCTLLYDGTTNFIGTTGFGPRIYPIVETGTSVSKFLILCQTSTTVGSITADAMIFDMNGTVIKTETGLLLSVADIFESGQTWRYASGPFVGFKEGAIYIKGVLDPTSSYITLYKYVVSTGDFHGYQLVDTNGLAPSIFSIPLMQQHFSEGSNTSTIHEFYSLGYVSSTYSGIDRFNITLIPYEEPETDDVIQLVTFY